MELVKISPASDSDESTSRQIADLRERLSIAVRIADSLVPPPVRNDGHAVTEHYVRSIVRFRRQRDSFFRADLFADPAWDMLLVLYAAALGQYRVSVSALCVGAAVPQTTALRWMKQLEDEGLIARRQDPTDGRRQFVMLTDKALQAMNAYFRTVPVGASLI